MLYCMSILIYRKCCYLTGAPDGGVPQNICSAVEIQLAGKLIIAEDFSWEFRAFSSISSRAGWIFQTTERDWKNTLVGTSCKRHFVKDRWIKKNRKTVSVVYGGRFGMQATMQAGLVLRFYSNTAEKRLFLIYM